MFHTFSSDYHDSILYVLNETVVNNFHILRHYKSLYNCFVMNDSLAQKAYEVPYKPNPFLSSWMCLQFQPKHLSVETDVLYQ